MQNADQRYPAQPERDPENPHEPTATAPDSVPESVPHAARDAGSSGPDAADPPRAAEKSAGSRRRGDESAAEENVLDADIDADEGADAFETRENATEKERPDAPERIEEDHISLDTPD